jgi:hypothetical protein
VGEVVNMIDNNVVNHYTEEAAVHDVTVPNNNNNHNVAVGVVITIDDDVVTGDDETGSIDNNNAISEDVQVVNIDDSNVDDTFHLPCLPDTQKMVGMICNHEENHCDRSDEEQEVNDTQMTTLDF